MKPRVSRCSGEPRRSCVPMRQRFPPSFAHESVQQRKESRAHHARIACYYHSATYAQGGHVAEPPETSLAVRTVVYKVTLPLPWSLGQPHLLLHIHMRQGHGRLCKDCRPSGSVVGMDPCSCAEDTRVLRSAFSTLFMTTSLTTRRRAPRRSSRLAAACPCTRQGQQRPLTSHPGCAA